jgi:hypothetical protein
VQATGAAAEVETILAPLQVDIEVEAEVEQATAKVVVVTEETVEHPEADEVVSVDVGVDEASRANHLQHRQMQLPLLVMLDQFRRSLIIFPYRL